MCKHQTTSAVKIKGRTENGCILKWCWQSCHLLQIQLNTSPNKTRCPKFFMLEQSHAGGSNHSWRITFRTMPMSPCKVRICLPNDDHLAEKLRVLNQPCKTYKRKLTWSFLKAMPIVGQSSYQLFPRKKSQLSDQFQSRV